VTDEKVMDRIVHEMAWTGRGEMRMRAAARMAASSGPAIQETGFMGGGVA
jgi:hypothetical protein